MSEYRCETCGKTKPGEEMKVTASDPDNLRGTCKDCWDGDDPSAFHEETLLCDRCERDMIEDDIRIGLNDGVVCPECQRNEQLTKAELLGEAEWADTEANLLECRIADTEAIIIRALRAWARRLRMEAK